ncbi:MAG: inorganic diphosphatase [Myxococcales bacterium]|nr:inorganic diphosphatase [Myxococcales bacterium]MCB9649955.1 inorganic diphosphatase [Deltaproteobacteria bacterium]
MRVAGPVREAVIEVPRWSFVKRKDDGSVDYVSPLPSPFNYGSVPGTLSPDGDPLDALVLGPRLPRGAKVSLPTLAVVHILDAGDEDPKLVLGPPPLSDADRRAVQAFFRLYDVAKGSLNRLRGKTGETRFVRMEILD